MTTTNNLLETTAIGLACLLAMMILIRGLDTGHDGTAPPLRRTVTATYGSAPVERKPIRVPAVDPNDEVSKILADMALHD
jgi:hypothetical protein